MTVVAMVLMAAGALFLLTAAIGVVRLRDPLQQMHSATKAGTLGTALLILGSLVLDRGEGVATGLLAILFLLLTLPLGAQVLGRASYISGARLEGLREDPLAEELERADTPIR